MKQIHKVNRKGKRAVHKKTKKRRYSESMVHTTKFLNAWDYILQTSSKYLLLAREPQQKCCGFFCPPIQNPQAPRPTRCCSSLVLR